MGVLWLPSAGYPSMGLTSPWGLRLCSPGPGCQVGRDPRAGRWPWSTHGPSTHLAAETVSPLIRRRQEVEKQAQMRAPTQSPWPWRANLRPHGCWGHRGPGAREPEASPASRSLQQSLAPSAQQPQMQRDRPARRCAPGVAVKKAAAEGPPAREGRALRAGGRVQAPPGPAVGRLSVLLEDKSLSDNNQMTGHLIMRP